MEFYEKARSSIFACIAGDALGVPVQNSTRQELSLCSVKNMLGYGRFDHPEGTWSDDASMIFCTMESLINGYDIDDMGQRFCKWLFDAYWTPFGYVFDAGLTTFLALESIQTGNKSARNSGCSSSDDNGNGSLMRILPAALYFHDQPTKRFLDVVHEISAITHAHPRSKVGCGIYSLLVRELLYSDDKTIAYKKAVANALDHYNSIPEFKAELPHFMRILSLQLPNAHEDDISSSGYIVDTLEAAIWCLLKHNDTRSILLAAVNLGLDTDTTGTVAGGLAGLAYGMSIIPEDWLNALSRKSEIDLLVDQFINRIPSPETKDLTPTR